MSGVRVLVGTRKGAFVLASDAARRHWKDVKAAGHTATYCQQTADRRWERQA